MIDLLDVPTSARTEPVGMLTLSIDDAPSPQEVVVEDASAWPHLELGRIPVNAAAPDLASELPQARAILALDVLEHVLDEEAWLNALAQLLVDGGELTVRVPLEGPMAWLDALNIYRYMQDTTGLGKDLDETKLKGWHRHYPVSDLVDLLQRGGLKVTHVVRHGSPHVDALHFGALAWGMLRGRKDAESRIAAWRRQAATTTQHVELGPFSASVTVTARRNG